MIVRTHVSKDKKYWLLSVISDEYKSDRWRVVKCKCKCWAVKEIRIYSLVSWTTTSCWCKWKWYATPKKHWETSTRFYGIFNWIKTRCRKKGWHKDYWLRWIKCLWKNYDSFKEDMYESYLKHVEEFWEKQTSIDRIDVNWHYCKDNCKRSTQHEQLLNRRVTIKRSVDWTKLSLWERCDKYNLDYKKVYYRVYVKWESFKKILIDNWYDIWQQCN